MRLGGPGKPSIGGHEPSGVVAARGPGVAKTACSRRRLFHGASLCRLRDMPRLFAGWSQLCKVDPMQVFAVTGNGAHAPYIKVPVFTLLPLSEELSFEAGAAISCGTGTPTVR